jgi:hypothetical protein
MTLPHSRPLGIAIIPLADVVLRRFFSTGIPGVASFAAHLTLIVGLIPQELDDLRTQRYVSSYRVAGVARSVAAE